MNKNLTNNAEESSVLKAILEEAMSSLKRTCYEIDAALMDEELVSEEKNYEKECKDVLADLKKILKKYSK